MVQYLCATLMACSFATCGTNTSSAVQNEVAANEQDTDTETMIADVLTSQLSSAPKVATEAKTDSKEETVFVFTKADGQQDHVIVNEKLKNVTGKSSITDVSSLSNITNLTGDETSTTNGNSLTWAKRRQQHYLSGYNNTDRTCQHESNLLSGRQGNFSK